MIIFLLILVLFFLSGLGWTINTNLETLAEIQKEILKELRESRGQLE